MSNASKLGVLLGTRADLMHRIPPDDVKDVPHEDAIEALQTSELQPVDLGQVAKL